MQDNLDFGGVQAGFKAGGAYLSDLHMEVGSCPYEGEVRRNPGTDGRGAFCRGRIFEPGERHPGRRDHTAWKIKEGNLQVVLSID